MYYLWSLLLFSITLQFTWGWGDIGHRTVAYLAEKYLDKQGEQLVDDLITPDKEFDISDAAVWADRQKFRSPFTRPWHYLGMYRFPLQQNHKLIQTDAEDKPPDSCRVSYEADCNDDGCIISAIENMVSERGI
jgi:hypothetical protein